MRQVWGQGWLTAHPVPISCCFSCCCPTLLLPPQAPNRSQCHQPRLQTGFGPWFVREQGHSKQETFLLSSAFSTPHKNHLWAPAGLNLSGLNHSGPQAGGLGGTAGLGRTAGLGAAAGPGATREPQIHPTDSPELPPTPSLHPESSLQAHGVSPALPRGGEKKR